MKRKHNLVGLAMAAGVGITTGLIYFLGKLDGKCEAYHFIADCMEEACKEAAKTEN